MKCYQHPEEEAVGICKSCCKAVCSACVVDTGNGVVCSERCNKELSESKKISSKEKTLNSDGAKYSYFPTLIILSGLIGVLIIFWGIYNSIRRGNIDLPPILWGVFFLVVIVTVFIQRKK